MTPELAQAFLRLGSRVTLIARGGLLSKQDPAIGEGLRAALSGEGLRVLTDTRVSGVNFDGMAFELETSAGTREAVNMTGGPGPCPP